MSRPHRWAWDTGYAVMSKLTRRADVQLALMQDAASHFRHA